MRILAYLPLLSSVFAIKLNPLKPSFPQPMHTDYHTAAPATTPEDAALLASSGSRIYQSRLQAGLGVTLFGGSSFGN